MQSLVPLVVIHILGQDAGVGVGAQGHGDDSCEVEGENEDGKDDCEEVSVEDVNDKCDCGYL